MATKPPPQDNIRDGILQCPWARGGWRVLVHPRRLLQRVNPIFGALSPARGRGTWAALKC